MRTMLALVAMAAALALPAAGSDYRTFAMPAPGASNVDPAAADTVLAIVNAARRNAHLPPLAVSAPLASVALAHIHAMLRARTVGHVLPGETFLERFDGVVPADDAVAEVIVVDDTPADAARALLASPEHRAILVSPEMREIGLAAVDCAWGVVVQGDLAGTRRR